MPPLKVLLDTDPGGDDSFALFWLLSLVNQGLAELVAVTTADGNVAATRTFTSASQILRLAGYSEIEVGRGVPISGETPAHATHIHGSDGMGSLSQTLPEAAHDWVKARPSDQVIIGHLRAHPGEITLVAIAPFTNLAAAELRHPGILQHPKELVILAGAFQLNVYFLLVIVLSELHNRVFLFKFCVKIYVLGNIKH